MNTSNNNQIIPSGKSFGPYLSTFLHKYSLSFDEVAMAINLSKYTVERLASGKTVPTKKCYAEFCILFTVVAGKSFDFYKKMSRKDKDNLVAKILAGGSSVMTVGGMIELVSAVGIAGLSAAGITSGLAAIGSIVGGGMVAGIAIVALAPLAVGGIVYAIFKKKGTTPEIFFMYKNEIDYTNEVRS